MKKKDANFSVHGSCLYICLWESTRKVIIFMDWGLITDFKLSWSIYFSSFLAPLSRSFLYAFLLFELMLLSVKHGLFLVQIDLMGFLRQSKYWQRSGGRDHVFPMTHPNAFRFLRDQVNESIQVVVDFGRYPKGVSNLKKDVVSPYVHVVDSYTDDDPLDPYESRATLLFFRGRTHRKDVCPLPEI